VSFTHNGVPFGERSVPAYQPLTLDSATTVLDGTANVLEVEVPSSAAANDRIDFGWWELRYRRRFQPINDSLFFDSPGTDPVYAYELKPFATSERPLVVDVTSPLDPALVQGGFWDTIPAQAPLRMLRFEAAENVPRRYWVAPPSNIALVVPSDLRFFGAAPNLRSGTNGADYLVIYYDGDGVPNGGFTEAANALAAHRQQWLYVPGESPPHEVMKVKLSDIFNQFAGGRLDPGAIRSFLYSAVRGHWRNPATYVALIGDASYDPRNYLGRAPAGQPGSLLPTYPHLSFFYLLEEIPFACDDWLFDLDGDAYVLPEVLGGRLPVRDPATAARLVREKIIPYDANPERSEWKNEILLVADDYGTSDDPDCIGHLQQTVLLDTADVLSSMERKRVYLHLYPLQGDSKPQARAATLQAINEGLASVCYIGHGSPFKIADENIMFASDAETFTNGPRQVLFTAWSCDVGKFDDPEIASMGERMLLHLAGGSIAVVSATELGFAGGNVELAGNFFEELATRVPGLSGHPRPTSLALYLAKERITNALHLENRRRYPVLGDPGTALAVPTLWADVSLRDELGNPISQIQRGQTVVFDGVVRNEPGGTLRPLNGLATLLIEDSAPQDSVRIDYCVVTVKYPYQAAPMFRGDVSVSGGQFGGRFVVPADAKLGNFGRVRAYFRGATASAAPDSDGVGTLAMVVNTGTPPSGDDAGPTITLSFPGGATQVKPDAVLRVDLEDPSGIMITGYNPANSIFVTLDGNTTQRTDITPSFRYLNNSYQRGTAFFPLGNLVAGDHEVSVNAADNLAVGVQASRHRSKATLQFTVTDNPELRIERTFAFPNPVRSGYPARIVVDTRGGAVNALLRIYTVSGRLIRTLKALDAIDQLQIPWDGLDDEGNALGNGVYLYRVQINGREADGSSSPRQLAVAEGRIVVIQ
jgi:hypothetical protein